MNINLRPYQEKAAIDVIEAFHKVNSIMLQMPTGTGKTTVFSSIIKEQINKIETGKRVLVIVHRRELVHQIFARLRLFGIRAGVIMSGENYEPIRQVQVASIQSLIRKNQKPKNISLIVVDESHHILSKSYSSILKKFPQAKLLGVTATPIRLNGEGFTNTFEKLICSQNLNWFINNKYLSEYKHFTLKDSNINNLKIDHKINDYIVKDSSNYMSNPKKIADVVKAYEKYAKERKTIIFCVDIKHMNNLEKKFNQHNISCASINSLTPIDERNQKLNDFENSKIKILLNVNIFTEGFDCPDVETVILARPTKSVSLYLQQVGRALRCKESGYAQIIDCANLYHEHGSISANRKWSLMGRDELNLENKSKVEKTLFINENKSGRKVQEVNFDDLVLSDKNYKQSNYEEMINKLKNILSYSNNQIETLNSYETKGIIKLLNLPKIHFDKVLSKKDKSIIRSKAILLLKHLKEKNKIKKPNFTHRKRVRFEKTVNYYEYENQLKEQFKEEYNSIINIDLNLKDINLMD